MDVPVRIEEASYFRTRCKQRWEWVHGSKPVTLVRWQAGKAVNASRFPCASPSAKAEGSADIRTVVATDQFGGITFVVQRFVAVAIFHRLLSVASYLHCPRANGSFQGDGLHHGVPT